MAIARIFALSILVLLSVQGASVGMDALATPWIANLTPESVEFSLTDSRGITGNFQLRPGTILQYTVGPQTIMTFALTRVSGKVQFYDQASLERLRSRAGAPRDYLLILPDSVELVSKMEFKSRLAGFKREK